MDFHPIAEAFPMLSGDELSRLAQDVKDNGQLELIWIYEGKVLDGRNRWRACALAGVEPKTKQYRGKDPLAFVVSMNILRRHLNESQRGMAAARLKEMFQARAKDRQKRKPKDSVVANLPPQKKWRQEAAETVNVGAKTVQAAADVLEHGSAELIKAVERGEVAVSAAAKLAKELSKSEQTEIVRSRNTNVVQEMRRQKKAKLAEEIKREPKPKPKGPFRVIVLDPPWRYSNRANDDTHRGRNPYPDMSLDELASLPIPELAHKDCIAWLWTTNAFMNEAFKLLDSWGFESKTILTWAKDRMGLGDWLRGQTEHCLMSTRGKPVVTLTNQTTFLRGALRRHSQKPDEFYALVESLCPGSKLEMFSRTTRKGWHEWGSETGTI